jgi:hypothetical protein
MYVYIYIEFSMTTYSRTYTLSKQYISSLEQNLGKKDDKQVREMKGNLTNLKLVVPNMINTIKYATGYAEKRLTDLGEEIENGKESTEIAEEALNLTNKLSDTGLNKDNLDKLSELLDRINETINKTKLIKDILTLPDDETAGGYKKRKLKRTRARTRKHKWSLKYKRSIDCNHPKGFSQRQHCKYGRKNMRKLTRKK